MIRLLAGAFVACWLSIPAMAAGLDATAVNNAEFRARTPSDDKADAMIVKVQVLLDRALFSPGEIDGKLAENTQKALRAFAEAKSLSFQKSLTKEIWAKLTEGSQSDIVTAYTISDKDVKGPFLEKRPAKMEAMKRLKALGYINAREALAERFHMSEGLLVALNPGKKFDKPGETIVVINARNPATKLSIARIEVDKARETVKAFDSSNVLVAFFPASVGSEEKPTPSGTLKVTSAEPNPTYRYNPDYKFKGVRSKEAFTIKPGPNNPAGAFWIGLSAEGYGIHGTPEPSKVSKSDSHGCIRLTNWDVTMLGDNVKKGTPVEFVEGTADDKKS